MKNKITTNGQDIETVTSSKFLGINVDEQLTSSATKSVYTIVDTLETYMMKLSRQLMYFIKKPRRDTHRKYWSKMQEKNI